jgi:hypothetical protein
LFILVEYSDITRRKGTINPSGAKILIVTIFMAEEMATAAFMEMICSGGYSA